MAGGMTEPRDGPPNDSSGRVPRHTREHEGRPQNEGPPHRDAAPPSDAARHAGTPGHDGAPHPDPATRRGTPPQYKGAPLDPARGPGLGCFWIQVVVLAILLVATPVSVVAGAPSWVSGAMLIVTLVLLLFAGQTVIFLLRLVAADRRSRRRPLSPSARPTVGDLEERERPSQRPTTMTALGTAEESASSAPGDHDAGGGRRPGERSTPNDDADS